MTAPIGPLLPLSPGFGTPATARPAAASPGGFGNVLGDLLGQVRQNQAQAAVAEQQVVTGQAQDLGQVVLASERATLSLELALQVRNKVLEVYQDIMKMPL